MNQKDKQLAMEFPSEVLDAAVNKKFEGVNAKSRFDLFGGMTYITELETEDPVLREITNNYIQGFMDGWVALRGKLLTS